MAPLRDDHVDATRRALLSAARRRFGQLGFAGTSLDDIAADAGVTKGALYHHFRNKEHLFLEVYDQVEGELAGRGIEAAAAGKDAIDVLQRGFAAFLDLALDADVRRIAILDSPAVLDAVAKAEVDARHSLAAVRLAVEVGIQEGLIADFDPEVLAQLLMAACNEAALLIATDDDPAAARVEIGAALDHLIAGLAPRA